MSRQGTERIAELLSGPVMRTHYGPIHFKGLFLALLPLFLLNFSACGSAQVLGLPREEAAALLRKGDTEFIKKTGLPPNPGQESFTRTVSRLRQLGLIHPGAAFYAGLIINGEETRSGRKWGSLLFCAALESPSLSVRQEAARSLIPMILEPDFEDAGNILGYLNSAKLTEAPVAAIRSACLYRLGQYDEITLPAESAAERTADDWSRALALFSALKQGSPQLAAGSGRRETVAFLLNLPPGNVRSWAFGEALSAESSLDPGEYAALSARLSPGNYRSALNLLLPVLSDGEAIFFRYPELIPDLGRAFQYTPVLREEGAKIFASWEKLFDEENPELPLPGENQELIALIKTMDSGAREKQRYLLLHYLGRIERAREQYAKSSGYFMRALDFAPNGLESDACLWYILMNALVRNPSGAAALVLDTMPRWNDMSYFADILERLSCYLAGKRQWHTLTEVFSALERRDKAGASLAQYAWIAGRAAEEGYIKTDRDPEEYYRIALEKGGLSYYYRIMAAAKLGVSFAPEETGGERAGKETVTVNKSEDKTDFLLGFFEYSAASFALPHIRAMEAELSVPELRKIAGALAGSEMWQESLNLVSRYTGREDYEQNREDLLLFYPRPYMDLTEKYALEMNLGAEILYGLIRTESYFLQDIVSRSGAVGLTQLMLPTAEDMAGRIARRGGPDYRGPGGINLKDPAANIHIGSFYLRYLSEQLENPMQALLAYNGGLGRMRRWLSQSRQQGGLPGDLFLETIEFSETREYGRRVLAAAAVYGYLYYGMSMEEVAGKINKMRNQE